MDEAENRLNVSNGFTVWNSVGASLAHQLAAPAAPEDHWSSGAAGSSNIHTGIFATLMKYVQKTTSPIRLDFKAVTTLSKIVCLDSETYFVSTLNSATDSVKLGGMSHSRRTPL